MPSFSSVSNKSGATSAIRLDERRIVTDSSAMRSMRLRQTSLRSVGNNSCAPEARRKGYLNTALKHITHLKGRKTAIAGAANDRRLSALDRLAKKGHHG